MKWQLMDNAITLSEKIKMAYFTLTSNKFTNGPKVKELEAKWSEWVGCKHSLLSLIHI